MDSVTVAALYTFAAHYHSGQGSRGYRLLCMAERAWERRAGISPRLEYWEAAVERGDNNVARVYRQLVENHGNAI